MYVYIATPFPLLKREITTAPNTVLYDVLMGYGSALPVYFTPSMSVISTTAFRPIHIAAVAGCIPQ